MTDRQSRTTLAAWANVAEIIAALGVVIGFVFLTLELKENTDLTRAAAYDRSIERLNDWRATVVRDPDVSRLYLAYTNAKVEELNSEDTFRLQVLLTSLWGIGDSPPLWPMTRGS